MHAISKSSSRSQPRIARRGLAPLELVLSLPLMLFVMALIINFGVLACWKVRADTVARQAVWRARFDRRGQTDPLPTGWPRVTPPSDTVPAANPPNVTEGNPLFQDPFPPQQYPVARGPVLTAPNGGGTAVRVNQDVLDVTKGVGVGNGWVSVPMPLLPKLPKVTYNVQHQLLGGRWQFGEMGLPANESRRIPLLYPDLDNRFPKFFNNVVQQQRNVYIQAVDAIRNNGQLHSDLMPLVGEGVPDPITGYPGGEFYLWYSQFNGGYRPPVFYPGIAPPRWICPAGAQSCTLDSNFDVNPHVQAIGRVPERMKRAYIRLYNDQIAYWKAQMPPNNAEIQRLQNIINTQLNPFVTQ